MKSSQVSMPATWPVMAVVTMMAVMLLRNLCVRGHRYHHGRCTTEKNESQQKLLHIDL